MRSVEHAVLNGSTKWKTGMDIAGGVVKAMNSQGAQPFVKVAEALREFEECVRWGCVPKIVSSENASTSTGMNNPDYNLAIKAAVKASSNSESISEEDGCQSSLDESDKVTNQLVKESNQLGQDANQLGNTTNHEQPPLMRVMLRAATATAMKRSQDSLSSALLCKARDDLKMRRKQVREAKRLRMRDSITQTNELVQGILVPVKDLSLVRTTMEHSFNVADALPVLSSITSEDSPLWTVTSIVLLARKQKIHHKVRIVFPKSYESIPIESRYRRSITKLCTFAEEDLKTMHVWHEIYPKLVAVSDLAEWIRELKFIRISLPSPHNNCTNVDLKACAKRWKSISFNKLIVARFGQTQAHELLGWKKPQPSSPTSTPSGRYEYCGPLKLFFFECAVRGIPAPKVSREQVEYLPFRYFFFTRKRVFCRNSDSMHNCA
ncbi:hypothetical protein GN244_ATG00871 [Phytophthora infestans]|uniref:Uncharacterized protein n=1 Tax=Phytophthora infestans TaxID=4787 RepID=A0A833T482_PHYIN|nr:hypothetical protein GN244_ATG00871 [Phytophthora infestans]